MEAALAFLACGATLDVPAGGDLAAAVARARPGDAIRLGPGEHRGALGTISGVTVSGAGAGTTTVVAPQGADGVVVAGDAVLAGLSIRAGPARSALKVTGGSLPNQTGGTSGNRPFNDFWLALLPIFGVNSTALSGASGALMSTGALPGIFSLYVDRLDCYRIRSRRRRGRLQTEPEKGKAWGLCPRSPQT
jgi:hypothetical protein